MRVRSVVFAGVVMVEIDHFFPPLGGYRAGGLVHTPSRAAPPVGAPPSCTRKAAPLT